MPLFSPAPDPYVPAELREFTYRDIFRVLEKDGSVISSATVIRMTQGICERSLGKERRALPRFFRECPAKAGTVSGTPRNPGSCFEAVGFSVVAVLMNSSVWRLDKP
jgi:hypothetical protein